MSFFNWSKPTNKPTRKKLKKMRNKSINNKTMNCSPLVEGQTVSDDTCYTSDALLKIATAYNKNNPTNKIVSTDPKVIFAELKTKLTKCKKEDCWLSQLPESEQKYLDEFLFAPDKPSEWKKNAGTDSITDQSPYPACFCRLSYFRSYIQATHQLEK